MWTNLLRMFGICVGLSAVALASPYGFGTPVDEQTVAAFNVRPSIAPDGRNLPKGRGDYETGAEIYLFSCVACHGMANEPGIYKRLFADAAFDNTTPEHLLSVGNYWPYATTLFDYISRAMPFAEPGSLSADEVYSVVTFILVENGIIPQSTILDAERLPIIEMPAKVIFTPPLETFLP